MARHDLSGREFLIQRRQSNFALAVDDLWLFSFVVNQPLVFTTQYFPISVASNQYLIRKIYVRLKTFVWHCHGS